MEQQKELCVEVTQDMLDCANNDLELMKTIITDNETWVYVTIQKANFNLHNGSIWNHQVVKKHDKLAAV